MIQVSTIVFVALTTFLILLYLFLSPKDTLGELAAIFERRHFRRSWKILSVFAFLGLLALGTMFLMGPKGIQLLPIIALASFLIGAASLFFSIEKGMLFDWNLIRRNLRQFTVMRLLEWTFLGAFFSAVFVAHGRGVNGAVMGSLYTVMIGNVLLFARTSWEDSRGSRFAAEKRRARPNQPMRSGEPLPKIEVYSDEE